MLDVQKFISELHDYIGKAVSPLVEKIAQLEKQIAEFKAVPGEKGDPGPPGKDAEPAEITHEDIVASLRGAPDLMRDVVTEYLKENPPPAGKDGIDGADGKNGEKGTDGADGKDGRDGIDGKDGEKGADGKDGLKGIDGKDGRDGIDGKDGQKGADGIGLSGFLINRAGNLIATTTDGRTHDLGHIIGKDGADLTDVEFDYDGERTISVSAKGGQAVNKYTMPVVIDRGYWRKGMECQKGDGVTHDGSWWIALKDTSAKPSTDAKDDWRLGARKGRDGTTVVKYADKEAAPVDLKGKNDGQ
jgi:integrin beta 3